MEQPQPGAVLGHYKIIRRLGAGGMGVVYEAEDLKLGRHAALKLLSGTGDPAALDRFWREARAVSALNHPGICTLYEINETEQQPFLVMELLEGQSLERHQGRAVPLNRLVELGIQIADALDAAHHKGILHRDVKPANIFVTKTGQVKILDFGLARIEETTSEITDTGLPARHMITQPGSTLGTIAYMSPEQARGEPLDARSDVFSLGVVLYEMATGKHPFNGTTTAIVFDKLLNYVPPTPASLNMELPLQFESIVSKALEKNRNLRYQSAAEIRADLLRLQRSTSDAPATSAAMPPVPPQYEGMTHVSNGGVAVATAPPATVVSGEHAPNPLTAFDSSPNVPSVVAALREAGAAPAPSKPPSKRPFLPVSLPLPVPLSPKRIRQAIVAAAILVVLITAVALRLRHHPRPKTPASVPVAATTASAPATDPTPAPVPSAPPSLPATKTASPKQAPKPSAARLTPEETNLAPARSPTPNPASEAPASPATAPSTPASNTSTAGATAPMPSPANPVMPPAPAANAPVFPTVSYAAHHEHAFPYLDGRSCSGTLELSANHLTYISKVHPISLTRDDVTSVEGNGVIDTAGKRYRFQIEGMSNKQVHDLLAKWLSAGQPAPASN